jgi:membrane associated rhomboid family serine protease
VRRLSENKELPAMAEYEKRYEMVLPSPRKIFTPAVTVMLVLIITGWTLIHYAEDFTANYLAISLQGILHGRIWQLLTYSFINTCPLNLVFNIIAVLFVGSAVERKWRTWDFILLWAVVTAICGIIWIIVGAILGRNLIGIGTDSFVYGLIAVFGLLYYRNRFMTIFWTLEAQHLAWILIAIGIILGIASPWTWIWITGALVAYLYVKLRWRISSSINAPSSRYKPGSFVDID